MDEVIVASGGKIGSSRVPLEATDFLCVSPQCRLNGACSDVVHLYRIVSRARTYNIRVHPTHARDPVRVDEVFSKADLCDRIVQMQSTFIRACTYVVSQRIPFDGAVETFFRKPCNFYCIVRKKLGRPEVQFIRQSYRNDVVCRPIQDVLTVRLYRNKR
jgi:hypothetical protein